MKTLRFQWGTSRGRDTYGYNMVSLFADGKRVASCNGGGYDMEGTVLGEWMAREFAEDLKKLGANYGSGDDGTGYYGLWFWNDKDGRHKAYKDGDKFGLDGACGMSSMQRILSALGYRMRMVDYTINRKIFVVVESE